VATSICERIQAGFKAALLGGTAAGANVTRDREQGVTRTETPAIVILYGGEETERAGSYTDRNRLTLTVAIFVRDDSPVQYVDPIAVDVHRLITSDAALAALAADIRKEGTDFASEEADRTAGTLSVRYLITFFTRANDLTALP
jgi:hypothetical protein